MNGDADTFAQQVIDAGKAPDVILATDIAYEQALAFAVVDNDIPGVDIVLGSKRSYVTDSIPSLSSVLGYTGSISEEEYARHADADYVTYDRIGKQGAEKSFETLLRGVYGKEIIEVDSFGRYLRTITKQDPVDGARLTLGIDVRLQAYIELALQSWLKNQSATRASVVAMDPTDGTIRALVSWPSYDANLSRMALIAQRMTRS